MTDKGKIRFVGEVETAGETSIIRIFNEYCSGLLGVENYSHLFILYWIHLRDDEKNRGTLRVTPPRHKGAPLTGVFACRSPSRPNPIGLTVVRLNKIINCRLEVSGLDAFAGSPILDIKPYSSNGDAYCEAKSPEWSQKKHFI